MGIEISMNGICGIDPGLKGGIAFLNEWGRVHRLVPMPSVGKELNLSEIAHWIKAESPKHVFIEHSQAIPKTFSTKAAFSFGRNFGALEGIVRGEVQRDEIRTLNERAHVRPRDFKMAVLRKLPSNGNLECLEERAVIAPRLKTKYPELLGNVLGRHLNPVGTEATPLQPVAGQVIDMRLIPLRQRRRATDGHKHRMTCEYAERFAGSSNRGTPTKTPVPSHKFTLKYRSPSACGTRPYANPGQDVGILAPAPARALATE